MARPKAFTIIDMVCDPEWLGDTQISVAQLAILKALYGHQLTREELDCFLTMTEGRRPAKGGYDEATLACGIRSGKTEKIASNVGLFTAITFDREAAGMAPGEVPYLAFNAQDLEGARTAWSYVEGKARVLQDKDHDILTETTAQSRAITGREIRFASGVVAMCFPCKKAALRSKTVIGGVNDEIAWWETEEDAANADYEIYRTMKQRMTTVRGWGKLINISSPYLEHGVLYDHYVARASARRLFVQVPSWVLNPHIDQHKLAEARADDPEGYLRDYGAQFGKAGGGYYAPAEIDGAMREGRPFILQPREGLDYRCWIDTAFRRDLFACAIAHREGDQVVYDLVHWWKPEKGRPLDDKAVALELAGMLRPYRIDRVSADSFADVPFANDLAVYDIAMRVQKMSTAESFAMHKNFKAAMRRGLLNLPKHDMIRADVLSCRKMGSGNGIKIEAPARKGFHDDITKVCAAVALELMPVGTVVDIAELNKDARQQDQRHPSADWRIPQEQENAYGFREIGLGDVL